MKTVVVSAAFAIVCSAAVSAQEVPGYLSETYPPHALEEALALDRADGRGSGA